MPPITSLHAIDDDASIREAALTFACQAVELGQDNLGGVLPWAETTLGIAEYRCGHYPVAEQKLLAAETNGGQIAATSRFYRVMSLFQLGRQTDARELFTATEATMARLPSGARHPLADGLGVDNLIIWLAYKEAKALLEQSADDAESE